MGWDSDLEAPRPLTLADVDAGVAASIARAFAWHEPWGAWAFPDESIREETMTRLVEEDLRDRFLEHGECWTIAGVCVTLWMPPGLEVFADRRSEGDYVTYGEQADAMRAGDELVSSLKPPGEHWYLDTIATAPERIRQGLGARLLDHDLAIRDAAGDTCALDTHMPDNVAFYMRRGFEVVGEGKLPGGGPDLYMMLREPQS